ncbi:hypothetical protein [Azospirillum halopraeferens]|uniref:hypothetical protein n=1 Tax=Azospirillum halopraeferens TaxID=34010 RepID=UPI000412C464|nr:hypothetical protein [Azospirillum halopraeferens]
MSMGGKIVGEFVKGRVDKLLTPDSADKATRHRVRQFMETMEAAILEANCTVIGQQIPQLNQETFLRLAVRVAELRADYIRAGLKAAEHRHPDPAAVADLARLRQAYEELVAVFEAAQRVIERGYVKLG